MISRHLGFRFTADTMAFRGNLAWAQRQVLGMRVFFIVGYDPQRLLPSPERAWRDDALRRFRRYPAMFDEFDLRYPHLAIEDSIRWRHAAMNAAFAIFISS